MARGTTRRPAAQATRPAPPLQINGWTILFHAGFIDQLQTLAAAYRAARAADPMGYQSNASVKVFAAVANLVLTRIPQDPGRLEYRQGNTLGKEYRDWFRAKFFQRFRLFFRYQTRGKIIVFAWVNDEHTLRSRGARNDPYEVFAGMLASGNPPSDWDMLIKQCSSPSAEFVNTLGEVAVTVKQKPRQR
jgi:toxin YhaV